MSKLLSCIISWLALASSVSSFTVKVNKHASLFPFRSYIQTLSATASSIGSTTTPTLEKVTSDGEVVKQLLQAGNGKITEAGDILAVEYSAYVQGETRPFAKGDRVKFVFKDGSMVKGWDAAVATMKIGEKARFAVSSKYGYGSKGVTNVIPPNAKVGANSCLHVFFLVFGIACCKVYFLFYVL